MILRLCKANCNTLPRPLLQRSLFSSHFPHSLNALFFLVVSCPFPASAIHRSLISLLSSLPSPYNAFSSRPPLSPPFSVSLRVFFTSLHVLINHLPPLTPSLFPSSPIFRSLYHVFFPMSSFISLVINVSVSHPTPISSIFLLYHVLVSMYLCHPHLPLSLPRLFRMSSLFSLLLFSVS